MLRLSSLRALLLAVALASPLASAQTTSMLEPAFPGLSFSEPIELEEPIDGRIYVAEKAGRIQAIQNLTATGLTTALDIRSLVRNSGERGLLGMAFHPNFAQNGYVFVHYSNTSGETVVARYTRSTANPDVFDPATALILLQVDQPFSNHNGGKIAFGPDGFLYLSLGDGGSGGDPGNRSQNRATLLGKLLRIDIDTPPAPLSLNYSIPADNPFVGNSDGFQEEIYAYGLRNMFKFSFDRETGALWGADVGQNEYEEVNLVENGGNYGWRLREGAHCFNPSTNCPTAGLIDPVYEYAHNGGSRSVTGGVVYRGSNNPDLVGDYLFADYIVGDVWALDISAQPATRRTIVSAGFGVIAFAEDFEGEVYILIQSGQILRFVSTAVAGEDAAPAEAPALRLASSNPFTGRTLVDLTPSESGEARVTLTDVLGRRVAVLHDGPVVAGERRRLSIDGTGLAAGVYLVRLDAAGSTSFLRIVRAQ